MCFDRNRISSEERRLLPWCPNLPFREASFTTTPPGMCLQVNAVPSALTPARDVSAENCDCLNGGWCREGGDCDCSQFQGLVQRCQIRHDSILYTCSTTPFCSSWVPCTLSHLSKGITELLHHSSLVVERIPCPSSNLSLTTHLPPWSEDSSLQTIPGLSATTLNHFTLNPPFMLLMLYVPPFQHFL